MSLALNPAANMLVDSTVRQSDPLVATIIRCVLDAVANRNCADRDRVTRVFVRCGSMSTRSSMRISVRGRIS